MHLPAKLQHDGPTSGTILPRSEVSKTVWNFPATPLLTAEERARLLAALATPGLPPPMEAFCRRRPWEIGPQSLASLERCAATQIRINELDRKSEETWRAVREGIESALWESRENRALLASMTPRPPRPTLRVLRGGLAEVTP